MCQQFLIESLYLVVFALHLRVVGRQQEKCLIGICVSDFF